MDLKSLDVSLVGIKFKKGASWSPIFCRIIGRPVNAENVQSPGYSTFHDDINVQRALFFRTCYIYAITLLADPDDSSSMYRTAYKQIACDWTLSMSIVTSFTASPVVVILFQLSLIPCACVCMCVWVSVGIRLCCHVISHRLSDIHGPHTNTHTHMLYA